MSPWEARTFTAAAGPAFKTAALVETVTGHPDLAPTILSVLGLPMPDHIEGRVLEEALVEGAGDVEGALEEHTASRSLGNSTYEQRLLISRARQGGHLVAADARRCSGS